MESLNLVSKWIIITQYVFQLWTKQQQDNLMNVGWLNLQCIMGSQVIKLLEYCYFLCSDTTF